jgi:hypothetical protein
VIKGGQERLELDGKTGDVKKESVEMYHEVSKTKDSL